MLHGIQEVSILNTFNQIDYNVASCTTDLGVLHVFDIRTDQSKPAFVYDTRKIVITKNGNNINFLFRNYILIHTWMILQSH